MSKNNELLHYVDRDGDELRVVELLSGEVWLAVGVGHQVQTIWLEPMLAKALRDLLTERAA